MNITHISQQQSYNQIENNIEKMGELLKDMTAESLHIDNKMMKASVIAKVTGLGNTLDTLA